MQFEALKKEPLETTDAKKPREGFYIIVAIIDCYTRQPCVKFVSS